MILKLFNEVKDISRIMKISEPTQKIKNLYELVLDSMKRKDWKKFSQLLAKLDDFEQKFEESYGKKKKEGVFYTRDDISDFMVTQALIELINYDFPNLELTYMKEIYRLNSSIKKEITKYILNITLCDPACGSGNFLLSAAKIFSNLISKLSDEIPLFDIKSKILAHLFGFEISNSALQISKLKLIKWYNTNDFLELGNPLNILNSNLQKQNSLINLKESIYDIIIGNPPYGNILNNSHKEQLRRENIFYNDIYCAFILKALNWTEKIVAFLVPKSFLLRQGYIDFRNDLFSKSNLLKIYDIGPNLFKKATNEVQLIIYEKKIKNSKHLQIYDYPDKKINQYLNQRTDDLRYCFNDNCNLYDKSKKLFVYTFRKNCPYCDSKTRYMNRIRIKTDPKTLSLIEKIEKHGNLNYLNIKDFPMMIRGEEAKGLKKIKEILQKNSKQSCVFINAKDDFSYFYFEKTKSFNIEKIDSKVLKGRNYRYYINPKLLIKHNNIYPQALFTEDKVCFTSSIYSLLHSETDELKYLCAVLNSALIQFYCVYGINNQKNTTVNLNQYMIRHLPIIKNGKNFRDIIISDGDSISNLFSQTKGKISNDIKNKIREIDDRIFELYSISDDEKGLIIKSIKNQIEFFRVIY